VGLVVCGGLGSNRGETDGMSTASPGVMSIKNVEGTAHSALPLIHGCGDKSILIRVITHSQTTCTLSHPFTLFLLNFVGDSSEVVQSKNGASSRTR